MNGAAGVIGPFICPSHRTHIDEPPLSAFPTTHLSNWHTGTGGPRLAGVLPSRLLKQEEPGIWGIHCEPREQPD